MWQVGTFLQGVVCGYKQPTQLGCTSDLLKSPVNLDAGVQYNNYSLTTDYSMVNDLWFQLNTKGLYEINSNFGVVNLAGIPYTMHRLTFLAGSETKLNGIQYPLEMQVEGSSREGKKLVVSALFKKTLIANPILMKLGIGVGLLKEIGSQIRSKGKKISYRFSLKSLFKNTKEYIRFKGSLF